MKIGAEGKEVYVYCGDVANTAIKMAGSELNLFTEKKTIAHRTNFDDLSDLELVQKVRDEAQVLLEHHEREQREAGEADPVLNLSASPFLRH